MAPENVPVVEIRKAKGPNLPFNPQQEKATFMEARREFATNDVEASTSKASSEPQRVFHKDRVLEIPREHETS